MFGILKNVGSADKTIRLGLALLASVGAIWAIGASSVWMAVGLGAGAAILLGTALLNTCPLYLPFGISTRRGKVRA
jgi:Protein of unknown function (DUF2892)